MYFELVQHVQTHFIAQLFLGLRQLEFIQRMYPVPEIVLVHVFVDKRLVLIVLWVIFGILSLMSEPEGGVDVVFIKAIVFIGTQACRIFQRRQPT